MDKFFKQNKMKKITVLGLSVLTIAAFTACSPETDVVQPTPPQPEPEFRMEVKNYSTTPGYFKKFAGFNDLEIYSILSSNDVLAGSPAFIYGSMADGAGLLKSGDGYSLINNIEADYSIARINLDKNFKPLKGDYILNAIASGSTAQCSGSLITPEEHGFGPLYLSGGEWAGASKGVFAVEVDKPASQRNFGTLLNGMGQWATENAVALGKDAYPNKTVVVIGDDDSDGANPQGHFGMYVSSFGDLTGGKLYGLKVTSPGINYEVDMREGVKYNIEFVELTESGIDALNQEAIDKGVMGFTRVEDLDWRRGSANNNREVYFAVTGSSNFPGKGTKYGRVYKVELNDLDPTLNGKITCVVDGDKMDGKGSELLSPDNILTTENYVYVQEDPNFRNDALPNKNHFARVWQYNIRTGEFKKVLEADQVAAAAAGIGTTSSYWEITGMIDVSDIVGEDETFIMITQNHGWIDSEKIFTDPTAVSDVQGHRSKEGSQLFLVKGLDR